PHPPHPQLHTLSLHDALPIFNPQSPMAPMDHLWSPWRLPYVIGEKSDEGCVFCNALAKTADEGLVLWRSASSFVILNKYPYNNRSEEHTSELQSRGHLVCRLL